MGNVIKIIVFTFISCQFFGAGGFGFVVSVFAAESASLSVKSDGPWQKPALLSKAVNSGNRPIILSPAAAINDNGDGIAVWVQPDKKQWPRVQKSEYRDGKWHLPGQLLNNKGNQAAGLALSSSFKGNSVIVWTETDGKNEQIYSKLFRVKK